MEFSGNILLLEKDQNQRQAFETILSFLGSSCQSGDIEDCLSFLQSEDNNVDVCFVGQIDENVPKLIKDNPNIAFIVICDHKDESLDQFKNFIGTITSTPSYDEFISLLHYCQSFKAMQKVNCKQQNNTLIKLLVGKGPAISNVRKLIEQVAPTDANVLILGESGTGKEVVAKAIHEISKRSQKPFVPVNCGAIPGELLESELFGHEKGAFTGAFSARAGRFEMAQGGTLFLDEIGDMPLQMQVKLLRVLQERKFERVGSNKAIEADVRIIAATHQNLEQMVEQKTFREDLYYRLNVFPIETPALRNRVDDIPLLIQELVNRHGNDNNCKIKFTQRAMSVLMQNTWKGNVRELSNLIERLLILHPNEIIDIKDLPLKYQGISNINNPILEREALLDVFSSDDDTDDKLNDNMPIDLPQMPIIEGEEDMAKAFSPTLSSQGVNLKDLVSNIEISMIKQALEQSGGVVAKAADILSLRRTTLVEKIKKYGIGD